VGPYTFQDRRQGRPYRPPALEILANIERLPDNPWVIDGKITLPVRATSPAEAS
jgi:hypothetical protein